MQSLEKQMVTELFQHDLIVINGIITEMYQFTGYYGEYCKLNCELSVKEFCCLQQGIIELVNQSIKFRYTISVYNLSSVLKSFKMLQNRYLHSVGEKNFDFVIFLQDASKELSIMLEQVTECKS